MATPVIKEHSTHNSKRIRRNQVRNQIKTNLLTFKLPTLLTDEISSLLDINIEEIKEIHSRLKLLPNKKAFVELLYNRTKAFNTIELEDILHTIQLYKCSIYYKSKNWMTIKLLEPYEHYECPSDVKIINKNLREAIRIKGLNAVVKGIEKDDLCWLMIVEKKLKKRGGILVKPPIFFSFEIGSSFIFFSKFPIRRPIMNCILQVFQYHRLKIHNLQGKDVKSMKMLLDNRVEYHNALQPVFLPLVRPIVSDDSVNHCEYTSRKRYAEQMFTTKEPINLDSFTANVVTVWLDNRLVPTMAGEPFRATLIFKSKNLFEMIKYSVSNDLLVSPVPEYIFSILRTGKNKVELRHQSERENK